MNLTFHLEITGLSEMERQALDRSKTVLWRCMNKMNELAKHFVPVDTGRLKNSIRLEPMHSGEKEYVLADGVTYNVGNSNILAASIHKAGFYMNTNKYKYCES